MSEPLVVITTDNSAPAVVVAPVVAAPHVIVTAMQGPPGIQGLQGDATSIVASTTLSGHRVLAANGDGQAIYAQHSDNTALAVQGLSTQAGVAGDTLILIRSGVIDWPASGLTAGLPLFLTTDGQLSHTPPSTGWIRQIAVAVDSDTLSIDIAPAWRVGA